MAKQTSQQDGESLSDLLDGELEATEGQEKVTLGDLLDNAGQATYGPPLLILALIALSPLGVIPGIAVVTATLIVLLAGQMLVGRRSPWLPRTLRSWSFERTRLEKAIQWGRGWVRWIDGLIATRWTVLTGPPFVQGLALIFIALALAFYPLALVPFGVAAPSGAAALLALGLTARDGVVVVLGLGLAGLAGWVLVAFWPF